MKSQACSAYPRLSRLFTALLLSASAYAHAQSGHMVGEVIIHAFDYSPSGTLPAHGQLVSQDEYSTAYAIMGQTWGVSGTSFRLPDLRGRSIIGQSQSYPFGTAVGAETAQLTALSGTVGHTFSTRSQNVLTSSRVTSSQAVPTLSTQALNVSGSGERFNIRPPSLVLNHSVVLEGETLSRECIVGEIMHYAGTVEPDSGTWFPADGRLLSIEQNIMLFSVIGPEFGGNGINTFALPDLKGRFAVHHNSFDPTVLSVTKTRQAGSDTVTLGLQHLPLAARGYTAAPSTFPYLSHARGNTLTVQVLDGLQPVSYPAQSVTTLPPALPLEHYICHTGIYPSQDSVDAVHAGYLGEVRLFAFDRELAGWHRAEGALLSIPAYPALYTLLGSAFDSNYLGNYFQIPNLRGRLPVGQGSVDGTTYETGDTLGSVSVMLTPHHLPGSLNLGNALSATAPLQAGAVPTSRNQGISTVLASDLSRVGGATQSPITLAPPMLGLSYQINTGSSNFPVRD